MVNKLALLGLASFGALLTGCPDDLGKNVGGATGGLRAPTLLQASSNGNGREVYLSWEDQSADETGFRLEISPVPFDTTGSSGMIYKVLPTGVSTFTYLSVPHTLYYFRIFAVTDTLESEPSNEITILTPYALPAPGNPSAEGINDGSTSFILKWGLVSEATGYQIEYMAALADRWSTYPLSIAGGVDRAVVSGFQRGQTYYLRVIALGPWGNSLPSNVLQVSIVP